MAKKLITRIVLILSMLLTTCEIWSQESDEYALQSDEPYLETYLGDLASASINDIVEDEDGFIWCVTRDGIVRYDGIGYVIVTSRDKDQSVERTWFSTIIEDKSSNCLWARTANQKRVFKIDKSTCTAEEYVIKTKEGKIVEYKNSLYSYNDTTLLIVSSSDIFLADKRSGIVVGKCDTKGTVVSTLRTNITGGRIIITYKKKLYDVEVDGLTPRLRLMTEAKISDQIANIPHAYYSNDTTVLMTYSKLSSYEGKAQVSGKQAISRCNIRTGEVEEVCIVPHIVNCMVEMPDGIWIGTQFGMFFYSYKDKVLRKFTMRNSKLPSPRILSLATSKTQPIVWIGTLRGLVKNDYFSSKFSQTDLYKHTNQDVIYVYSVFKDCQGGYWLSTSEGLLYRKDNDFYNSCGFEKRANRVRAIFSEDTCTQTLYITKSDIVYVYDLNKEKLVCSHELGESIERSMHVAGDTILMAQGGKLLLYNARLGRELDMQILSDTVKVTPRSLMRESDSIFWVLGTFDRKQRLYRYNIDKRELTTYTDFDKITEGKDFRDARLVKRSGIMEMWFSSLGDSMGLYYFLPDRRKLVKVEYSQYFDRQITDFEVDNNGNIWTACDLGIACIDNNSGRVYEYSCSLYSIPRGMNVGSSSIASDGSILFASTQSFVEFSTNKHSVANNYYPEPIITQYQYRDAQTQETDSLTSQWTVELVDSVIYVPKGIRSLAVSVRVLNYSKSEYNMVQWRCEGDNIWKHSSTMIPLMLSNLKCGETKVYMRSVPMYAANLEDMPIKTLYIQKDGYIYESIWFQIVAVIIALMLVSLILIKRNLSQRKRRLQLQLEVELRTAELQNTNIKLSAIQERVAAQNKELIRTRDHLEEMVAERTEQLEKEKSRIEEGSKLKSAFLANLSHEVRTPMNCIVGFSKLLADPTCTKEESVEFVHLIKESATSLLALLGDLLDVSRIESGQMRVNFGNFPVMRELQDVYKMLTIEKKKKKVDFLLNVQPNVSDVVLYSDKDRFRQVIINIVYNAFKFTDDGHVTINARVVDVEELPRFDYPLTFLRPQDEKVLLISIEDTGIGMPEDKLDVIFEPFRKLNNNKTLYPGLGLGLNICKNLIELVGGKIWVRSRENMGTTFFFYHPIFSMTGEIMSDKKER